MSHRAPSAATTSTAAPGPLGAAQALASSRAPMLIHCPGARTASVPSGGLLNDNGSHFAAVPRLRRVAGVPVLEVRELSVRRGNGLALERLSFTLQAGTLTALVGPNGAGRRLRASCPLRRGRSRWRVCRSRHPWPGGSWR